MKNKSRIALFLLGLAISPCLLAKNIYGTSANDSLNGTSENDTIVAYGGADNANGQGGNDIIYGGMGNDHLDGGANSDRLMGDRGNDKLYGGNGNDRLYGGKDHDNLYGESGSDQLYGGAGNDYLSGGSGNDTYYYSVGGGYDVIFQDTHGTDKLIISGIQGDQISIYHSGADKIIQVPDGRIIIQNYQSNVIESIQANGIEISTGNNTPPPQISSLQYTTTPLVVGSTETLKVTLSESSYYSQKRSYFVEVDILRNSGSWTVASGYLNIAAGQTTASANFPIIFNMAGTVTTKINVYDAGKSQLLASRSGSNTDQIQTTGGSSGSIANFPYFWQLNNSYNPYGSCQNTSIAMVLKYYGANITPDSISGYWGTSYAQTIDGLRTVFNSEAAYHGVGVRLNSTPYGTLAQINQNLAAGKPVIVHGYTTSYGHVLVLVGFDGTYYTAHDPYGDWNEVPYSSGYYKTSTAGRYVKYHKNSIQSAFAPDGYVWMHTIR